MTPKKFETITQRPFAVIQTTSPLEELRLLLGNEVLASDGEIAVREQAPSGSNRFLLQVVEADSPAIAGQLRSVLRILLDAADRGLLADFKIIEGANLLRRPYPGTTRPNAPRSGGRF